MHILNRTFKYITRCLKYLNNGSLTMRYSIVHAMSNNMNLHVVIINCKLNNTIISQFRISNGTIECYNLGIRQGLFAP